MVKSTIVIMVREISEVGGRSNQGDRDERNNLYCTRCDKKGHGATTCRTPLNKIKERNKKMKKKNSMNSDFSHYVTSQSNTIIETLCNFSFAS